MLNLKKPLVMGIVNVTPDSFSSVGRIQNPTFILKYVKKIISDGANIVDIGAEPTNPGMRRLCLSLQEELDRLIPVLEHLQQEITVPISVDTSKPEVMEEAVKYGASIINDVRAFRYKGALETIAKSDLMVCVMHMSYPEGKPGEINHEEFVPDVMTVIKKFLKERIQACENAGIKRERIIIDPGIGYGSFGKSLQDNLKIVKHLDQLKDLNLPILVGASRKTFIGDILKNTVSERLAGSLAVATLAICNGATIIRTHDVKQTADAIKIAMEIQNAD